MANDSIHTVSIMSFEGFICLEILDEALDGSSSRDKRNNQASATQYLQPGPSEGQSLHFGLLNLHLYGEVNG